MMTNKNEILIMKALKILLDREQGGKLGDYISKQLSDAILGENKK